MKPLVRAIGVPYWYLVCMLRSKQYKDKFRREKKINLAADVRKKKQQQLLIVSSRLHTYDEYEQRMSMSTKSFMVCGRIKSFVKEQYNTGR